MRGLERTPLGPTLCVRGVRAMKRRITTLLAGGVLALALFGEAMAGPLEDFDAAYQHGDFAAAVQLLRPLADQGNALAQTSLGIM